MDTFRRLFFQHHRLIAAICAGLAVLTGLSAVKQSPEGVRVLVARHDLTSGHVITAGDVRTSVVPVSARPSHTLTSARAVGRQVAGPMRAGEPLTDYRVLEPGALDAYGPDAVLIGVPVPDIGGLTGVRVGDRIDIIAVDPHGESQAEVVARGVEVVMVPRSDDDDAPTLSIVTTERVALALATAGLESRFTVMQSS